MEKGSEKSSEGGFELDCSPPPGRPLTVSSSRRVTSPWRCTAGWPPRSGCGSTSTPSGSSSQRWPVSSLFIFLYDFVLFLYIFHVFLFLNIFLLCYKSSLP